MDASSSTSSLGKLLPKSITAKRRRRKEKQSQDSDDNLSRRTSQQHESSDDARSANLTGDGEADDDRSFGSRASSLVPDNDSYHGRPTAPFPSLPSTVGHSSPMTQATPVDSLARFTSPLSQTDHTAQGRARSPASSNAADSDTSSRPLAEPAPVAQQPLNSKRSISSRPPQTPPTVDTQAPAIVNTPPTPTDSPRAITGEARASTWRAPWNESTGSPTRSNGSLASSQTIAAHRKTKSDGIPLGPSKLSSIVVSPPSPSVEGNEATPTPTAGGGAGAQGGFFSSMISAAQNAATSISTNIQNTSINIGGNKGRATPSKATPPSIIGQVEVEPAPEANMGDNTDEKVTAVQTLGAGDLSLSHLGLAEPASRVASPSTPKFPDLIDTRARSESAPVDSLGTGAEFTFDDAGGRPPPYETQAGDQFPSQVDSLDKSGIQRSSSIKSAVKPHRKRGSSIATTATMMTAAPGLAATTSAGQAPPGAPKLTGFAIASKKRNRDFHTLFKSVPDDDYLIEDYSCALQREILAHGRLYVSEGHLCFSSNILGWTTTLVMSFDEIVSVEKRSTALLFKNGLMISTLHAKHIFASFTSRDATYDLIVNIWKLGHPTLTSTLNGVKLEGTGGDKTEKMDADPSSVENETRANSETDDDSEDDEDEDEFYDEENDDVPETQATEISTLDGETEKSTTRKASGMTLNGAANDAAKEAAPAAAGAPGFPGPLTHAPTDCGDSATHYDRIVGDDVIAAPLGQIYDLLFGPTSVGWMSKWLTGDQKCTELVMEDKKGLTPENKTRSYSYIKPLNASIGPRQTKCIVAETLENLDFAKAANFTVSTQTPDVPSGNVFCVKTKYCLSWAENNATRVQVNCTIEWSGKSWLKGPIEKGAQDGQTQYCKDIFTALRAAISSRSRSGTGNLGAKSKKKGKRSKAAPSQAEPDGKAKATGPAQQSWGLLEPIHGLLKPITDMLPPFVNNLLYGLLVGFVALWVASWFGFRMGRATPAMGHGSGIYRGDRLMAYEETWVREENGLWEWLDERVGMERLNADKPIHPKKAIERRAVEERIGQGRMHSKEVEEAIRVTEEKLKILKDVMEKKSMPGGTPKASGISKDTRAEL